MASRSRMPALQLDDCGYPSRALRHGENWERRISSAPLNGVFRMRCARSLHPRLLGRFVQSLAVIAMISLLSSAAGAQAASD